jgi:PPP family 3-phenylpropionic acid transporter
MAFGITCLRRFRSRSAAIVQRPAPADMPDMHRGRIQVLAGFVLLYGMMYSAFGVASPFWPMFFESRGLSPQQLGTLLALGTVARLVAGPFVGRVADKVGSLRAVLAVCAAIAVVAALNLLPKHGYLLLLAISICQAAALAPITTIADALAIHSATDTSRKTFDYGLIRGIGSAAFVMGTLLAGQVLSLTVIGPSAIVWMHAALLSGVIIAMAWVPSLSTEKSASGETNIAAGSLRELLRNQVFRHVIAISALVFGSHAMHDAFAVIRWTAAGISPMTASLLWSEAVVAEVVVFFLFGPLIIKQFGLNGAAALAAIAGVARWSVMSQTTEVAALALVQPLHGFTFALLHLACIRLIGVAVSPLLAATAQSIYAFGSAIASATLTYLSGILYEQLGALGFLAMATLCGLAIPIALLLPHRVEPFYTSERRDR